MSATSGTRTTGPANAKPWIFENNSQGRFDVRRAAFTADLVEAEMRGIFDRSWLYAGHEPEIPDQSLCVFRSGVFVRSLVRFVAGGTAIVLLAQCGGTTAMPP